MPVASRLDAALEAVRRGFTIFPIVPNAKTPLISNWQNLATTDEAQIRQWWEETPDANIAGITADKIVVDIDPRNGGKETFSALALIEDFEKTTITDTQGGGNHIIYALPPHTHVKGGTNKLGPGVDIKSYGGYILLPGSEIDGRKYAWTNDRPIAPAMQWLIETGKSHKKKTDAAGKRLVEEDDAARQLAEKWLDEKAPHASFGERDTTAYKVAARLGDFGCGYETRLELLSQWNETHCEPPMEFEDLARACDSAGRNRENAIGSKHPLAPGFEAVEIDEAKAPSPETSIPRQRLFTIRADEGAKVALERRGDPLIKGVIDRGTMSVLVGKGGGGKTFLALDWSYHVATGRDWAGKKVKQGAVVYLAAEAGNMILSRLKALELHYGPLGDTPLYVIPCPANFSRGPEDVKAILQLIQEVEQACGQKVELFVVDTLARVMTGDENSAKDMGVIIESVDFIRQQTGCHGMLIHHPNKAGTSARGSGNVFGGTDTEMWVDEHKTLTFTKQRDMPCGPEIFFKLPTVQIGTDNDGAPITSCVVHVAKAGEAARQEPLTGRLADVLDELDAALEDAGIVTFDHAFLAQISFRHSSVKPAKRQTLNDWMTDLTENGYLKKAKRGQWVRLNDGNDGL